MSEKNTHPVLLWMIGLGLFVPLFFRLDGSIYADVKILAESLGVISQLPLPISIVACFAALLLLVRGVLTARAGLLLIAGTLACGILSIFIGGDGVIGPQRKLMMLAQVSMPMAGLLLGELVRDGDKVLARAFLLVLCVIVPMQLLFTLTQEKEMLTHYFHIFSIYSHIQFVTLIFVCAFVYAATSLWDEYKALICVLAMLMFFYVSRSYSFLTIAAYAIAVLVFAADKLRRFHVNRMSVIGVAILVLAVVLVGTAVKLKSHGQSQLFLGKFTDIVNGKIPPNVQERFDDWKLFGNGIVESGKTIVVGHAEPMPREIRSSPHNWYVEQMYTFGLVVLIPIMTLIIYTVYFCFAYRGSISSNTWWLAGIVFYLVVIDSNFKVTLRQPYPGIFAYFMWGLLFSALLPTALRKHQVTALN
ncbi:hypothetical protein B0B52_06100 [Polaromonas sp. A23]|nr:hypothetical protein B0B52_06100 [Polaromonas sp. A23]